MEKHAMTATKKENNNFGERFVNWKSFVSTLFTCIVLIFSAGAWAIDGAEKRMHPKAASKDEVATMRQDIKQEIQILREVVKEVKTDIKEMRKEAKQESKETHKMLTEVLLKIK